MTDAELLAELPFDIEKAEKLEKRLRKGQFDLEDFLEQLGQLREMGPLSQLLELVPGMGRFKNQLSADVTESELTKIEAIIQSMTVEERRNPRIISGSRKRRIAAGSGTSVQDVNALLKQFRTMQKMMKDMGKMMGGGGMPQGKLPFKLPPGFGM